MVDGVRLIFLVALLVAAAASMVLPAGLGGIADGPCTLPPSEANHALIRRCMAKTRITREVIAGRLTLFEAAARFRRVNQMNPAVVMFRCEGDSPEDGQCRQVISWAKVLLARENSDNLAAVGERLDEELRRHKEQHGKVILPDLDDTDQGASNGEVDMSSRLLLAAADPKSLAWIPEYEFVGMLLTLAVVIAVGVWVRVRQARAARRLADEPILDTPIEEDDEPILDTAIEEAETPPPVAFRCPACRKGLKAKAELEGKKVKCRQCGKVVLVPASRAAGNGHITK